MLSKKFKLLLTFLLSVSVFFSMEKQAQALWTYHGFVWICQDTHENCVAKESQMGNLEAITDTFFPVPVNSEVLLLHKGGCTNTTKSQCGDEETCEILKIHDVAGHYDIGGGNTDDHSCCYRGQGCWSSFIHPIWEMGKPPGAENPNGYWKLSGPGRGGAGASCEAINAQDDHPSPDCWKAGTLIEQQTLTIRADFLWIEPPEEIKEPPTANLVGRCDPALQEWGEYTTFSFDLKNISVSNGNLADEKLEKSVLFLSFLMGDNDSQESLEEQLIQFLGTPWWNTDLGNGQFARSYPLVTHTGDTEDISDGIIHYNISANTELKSQESSNKTIGQLMDKVAELEGTDPAPYVVKSAPPFEVTDPYTFSIGANLQLEGRELLSWADSGTKVDIRANVCAEPPDTPTPTPTPSSTVTPSIKITLTPTPTLEPDAPMCREISMTDDQGNVLKNLDDSTLSIGDKIIFNCLSDIEINEDYHFAYRIYAENMSVDERHLSGYNNALQYSIKNSGAHAIQCAVCNDEGNCDFEPVPAGF